MQTGHITYRASSIHYLMSDTAIHWVYCFHGYGESAELFQELLNLLPAQYGAVLFDLPYHGKTQWKENKPCDATDWWNIIDLLAGSCGIPAGQVCLLGYSLGGRVALSLYQERPAAVRKLLLLAPDGLEVNPWYRLATGTAAGRLLFRLTMQAPTWFFFLLKAGQRMQLANPGVLKFAQRFLNDSGARELLYRRWTGLRAFRPDLVRIRREIASGHTAIFLFYGRYDQIIRFEKGILFRQGLEAFCSVHILETGHRLLQKRYLPQIIKHCLM